MVSLIEDIEDHIRVYGGDVEDIRRRMQEMERFQEIGI